MKLSEEQIMLLDTARNFCQEKSSVTLVRDAIEKNEAYDPALWSEIAELGWLAVAVSEAHGGLDMGLASVVPIVEAMGRSLMGTPYLATTLAIQALQTSGNEAQKDAWLPQLASGTIGTVALTESDGSWLLDQVECTGSGGDELTLTGTKCQVLDAEVAELLIVSVLIEARPALVIVTKEQLPRDAIRREVVIDETRRSYTVDLTGLTVPADQVLPEADFAAIEAAALLLLSAEMAGGLSSVLHTIVEYLTTRKQFEQYIGSYQALKHPSVDVLLDQESAKSHVYHAAAVMAGGDAKETEVAVRMAKAQTSEAFSFAGDRAVQFHGGFGFTYECDAQLYLRRALWCQHQFGDERYHRQLLAPLLLD
ncbi:MAG: acyl-CoA dehydrogenase [Pseudomonadales bacterium]|nr:acyl-CoA dehydrogenase [Pseudomonadales bacterium]